MRRGQKTGRIFFSTTLKGDGTMTLKVGLIVGREWSFPPHFIDEVNRRNEGVTAEYVTLGAPRMDEPCEYAVIIDRISHEVPFYRTYLKQAVLQGCTVVNNPFMWTADDKFFGAALATSLGIAHPKTVVLPNKEYIPGIVHDESLRNLQYPLDWQGIVDYVGLPCVLKDAHGGGWKDVYICRSLEELIHNYDNSGMLTMVAQEFIKWDHFIRCICLGQEEVLPIKYDPGERKYHVDHAHMSGDLGTRVVADSLKLVRALGYDMNSMEWAVKDGVPYAIDFMNPAPDMDIYSLTEHYFEWVVQHMADMAIRMAKNPRQQAAELGWRQLFQGSRDFSAALAASPMIHAPTLSSADGPLAGSGGRAGGGIDATTLSSADGPLSGSGARASEGGGMDNGGGTLGSGTRADATDAATAGGGTIITSGGRGPGGDDGSTTDAGVGTKGGGGRSGDGASTADGPGTIITSGGRGPDGPPPGSTSSTGSTSDAGGVGGGRTAESGTSSSGGRGTSDDPGDLPDAEVEEQASEGHA
jgi:hypothetical protein